MRELRIMLPVIAALLLAVPASAGWGDAPDAQPPSRTPNPPAQAEETPADPPAQAETSSEADVLITKPEWEKWAFNLAHNDGDGYMRFIDLARSNKPFVLVWWVSDCSLCHLQLPYVQQLAKMADENDLELEVVSINIDADDEACQRYLRGKPLSFKVLRDPRARRTDKIYKVRDMGTPVTYVFKAGGVPAGSFSGFKKGFPTVVLDMLGLPHPGDG